MVSRAVVRVALMRSITDILLKLAYNFLNRAVEKELFEVRRGIASQ